MRQLRAVLARIAGFFAGHRADDDLQAELQSHLDLETAENIRRGMQPDAAVVDRLEERRIEAPQPGQGLSVHAVTLALTGIDEPELPRVRDQHLVAELREESAHPG
jgi:hypothetical protein